MMIFTLSSSAIIAIVLSLVFLSGLILFNTYWRKLLLSQWWLIPASIAWFVVNGLLSTSEYFLLWWIGVGLLLLLVRAFTDFPSFNKKVSIQRLRPIVIERQMINLLIQRGIRWWQIPKWCWLHDVFHHYYQETQSFIPLDFVEKIIENTDIKTQLYYNKKHLLKRGIYWYDIPERGSYSWLKDELQGDKFTNLKLKKELLIIVQGVLAKRNLTPTFHNDAYQRVAPSKSDR